MSGFESAQGSRDDGRRPGRPASIRMMWAQTSDGVIGDGDSMPWHIPEDLAHFKATTMGAPVIMGRRTWDSLPAKFRPLPGRRNVVLSRSLTPEDVPGAELAHSLDAALDMLGNVPVAWIIGGGRVYREALRIADEFTVGDARRTVILTGGIRTPSDALVGPVAVQALGQLHCDLVFMGVHGMDTGAGFTTPNLMEAETNRALVRSTRRLAVVADHSKWGRVGLSTIADLSAAHTLVTDDRLPAGARADLAARIDQVLMAPAGETDSTRPLHPPD